MVRDKALSYIILMLYLVYQGVASKSLLKKNVAGKIFKRAVQTRKVLDTPLMIVWDCPDNHLSQDVQDKLGVLRKRIRIYNAEETGNDIGKPLGITVEDCISMALFPRWLTIGEAIDQKAFELRTKQNVVEFQDWAWQKLSAQGSANIVNDLPTNITVYWEHVVTHNLIEQVMLKPNTKTTLQSYVGHTFIIKSPTREGRFEMTNEAMYFELGVNEESDVSRELNAVKENERIEKEKERMEKRTLRRKKRFEQRKNRKKAQTIELAKVPDAKEFKIKEEKKEFSGRTQRVIHVAVITFVITVSIVGLIFVGTVYYSNQDSKQSLPMSTSIQSRVGNVMRSKSMHKMLKRNID